MFPKPVQSLTPNTFDYELKPLVKQTGFREYDARWLFEKELNLMGAQALGLGLGTLIREMGVKPEIVTGHDYRSYSASIKLALINGLMASGCTVHDIGLAMSPMAYFAQFELDVPCVAMVTASHNDNGWTGVKMGAKRPVTFGPEEMTRLLTTGKTALLERLGAHLNAAGRRAAVIVGDLATDNDARRLQAAGLTAVQITTGQACHLEAAMVERALEALPLPLEGFDLLLIENVGNLVCPAAYDLGESRRLVLLSVTEGEDKPLKYPDMFTAAKVAILSVTEGEDKPLKYPDMFAAAQLMVINKIDLLAREKLLEIFGAYTQTDIHSNAAILRLLKLAFESAKNPTWSAVRKSVRPTL